MSKSIKILMTLSVILALCITGEAWAGNILTPTGRCTNMLHEGTEYYIAKTLNTGEADQWRKSFEITASSGSVTAIEMTIGGDGTSYQCTEESLGTPTSQFSCNSLPTNAIVTGIYFRVKNVTTPDFTLTAETMPKPATVIFEGSGSTANPPVPCSVEDTERDWSAKSGTKLVYNNSSETSCTGHTTIEFVENQKKPFKIVNIGLNDILNKDRFKFDIQPKTDYSYKLTLTFEDFGGITHDVTYDWDATTQTGMTIASGLNGLKNSDMPIKLIGGTLDNINTTQKNLDNTPLLPTSTDFKVRFYYENVNGTQGYENSDYHFERDLNIKFAPYCDITDNKANTGIIPNAVSGTSYDHCGAEKQLFGVSFVDSNNRGIVIGNTGCGSYAYCKNASAVGSYPSTRPEKESYYYFVTRKCTDSSCFTRTGTSAYLYDITVSDSDVLERTYRTNSVSSTTTSRFSMRVYGDNSGIPFDIRGAHLMAAEPGTYEVRGFITEQNVKDGNHDECAVKFYITVPETDSLLTCSSPATNGYYYAKWNDCLDYRLTQELGFANIKDGSKGFAQNFSNHGVHFYFNSEESYLPTALVMNSLSCTFKALNDYGEPGKGYCNKNEIYVPRNTQVTVNGGSFYLEHYPDTTVDNFVITYMRKDTGNKLKLLTGIQIAECKNANKIPNTGVSLRSPLTASVRNDSSFVFTGNSLRIPAIGLGMETPIPIVHVYYEDNDPDSKSWDLKGLGNYVGELEGGTYLPYQGNSVLTGHFYSMGVFKNLAGLNLEDEIIIYGNDGIKYTYHVKEKFIAQPDDVYSLFQQIGSSSLTLVTCENYNLVTDEYERRTVVRAALDSQEPYQVNW